MVRMSMNEMTTFSWTFDEDVRNYSQAGYEGIGVWRQKLADYGEERGIDLLIETGLHVSNLLWAGGFTGSDGRSHADSIEDGVDAIRLAAAMKADCLVVFSGARNGHTHNHAKQMTRDALNELTDVARDCDVYLALEPVHAGCGDEWSFLHDMDGTLDFLDQLPSEHVKIAFDTYHLGQECVSFDKLRSIASRIGIVHLADSRSAPSGEENRCLLGEGNIPIREIVETLVEGGFDGFCDVKLFGEDVENCDYLDILNHSKSAVTELIHS